MSSSIVFAILVTSLATYLSRFLGVISSEKIKETSKWFRWFNCLAYSTLAALIARITIFPSGSLSENSLSSDSQSPLRTCFLVALLLGEYLDVLGGHTNSYRNILSPFSCISELTLPRQPYILVSSSLNGQEC